MAPTGENQGTCGSTYPSDALSTINPKWNGKEREILSWR
jgi:hypothetical protein